MNRNDLPWVLGIDLGTGSCKSVAVDLQGQVLGFGIGEYDAGSVTERWKEQDPERLIQGMVHSVRTSLDQAHISPENCQGISLGGAMHTLMAINQKGQPLTGIITWVDDRAAPQAQEIRSAPFAKDLYQNTGCPVHCIYPLYKIIWLRQTCAENFKRASRFVSAKEYILWRLTGEFIVDPGIAAGSGLLHIDGLRWDEQALELAGIEPGQLSNLKNPLYTHLGIDNELAAAMGLTPNVRVVLGASDAVNSSLGAGATQADLATCMIGSSGAFRIVSPTPLLDEQARIWCYAIDGQHWLVGGAINNGGLAMNWLCDLLKCPPLEQCSSSSISVDELIRLASEVRAGAEGLICLPFFAGERSPNWNMNARGVFFGLSLEHELRHLARALLEGVAYRLRSVKDALEENGCVIRQIRASGGFTRSDVWLQIITNVMNRSLVVPRWGETSSLGAAFWVLLAIGAVKNLESLQPLVGLGASYEPLTSDAVLYDQLYRIYQEIYRSSQNAFSQLQAFKPQQDKAHLA